MPDRGLLVIERNWNYGRSRRTQRRRSLSVEEISNTALARQSPRTLVGVGRVGGDQIVGTTILPAGPREKSGGGLVQELHYTMTHDRLVIELSRGNTVVEGRTLQPWVYLAVMTRCQA